MTASMESAVSCVYCLCSLSEKLFAMFMVIQCKFSFSMHWVLLDEICVICGRGRSRSCSWEAV